MDTLYTDHSSAVSSSTLSPPGHRGATEGVTENDKEPAPDWTPPPPTLTTDQLQDARLLALSATPVSPRAVALVADVAALVARHDAHTGARKRGRGKAGLARQQQAVGAIIGGVLRRWGREEPQPAFRSRKRDDFTGGPVGVRQYLAACDALVALGLLNRSRSIRYGLGVWDLGGPESFLGKAARLWPTQALTGDRGPAWPDPGHPR